MTDASDHFGDVDLPFPVRPIAPRAAMARDLRQRLHRRLGAPSPDDAYALPNAAGLEYEDGGNPAGQPVLLLHAAGATSFVPLMSEPDLADEYRLIRCHRRGFAGSEGATDATIAGQVRDLLAFLDELGIDKAHIVGHSGSGVIALQLALDAPDVVRSLVLEEPAIHAIDPRSNRVVLETIEPLLAMHEAGETGRAMERWMRGLSPTWRVDLTRSVPCGPQQVLEDAEAFFDDVRAVSGWAVESDRVGALTVPVLYVVSGGRDPLTDALMRRFRSLLPETEVVVIDDATHLLHSDQPQAVAVALRAFFARVT